MAFFKTQSLSCLLLILCSSLLLGGVHAASGQCLESKCRGTRIHPWVDNDLELTCWIPLDADVKDPKFCADGYVGHIVEDVPHEIVDGELRAWYTCCEPDFEGVAQQTCKYSACSSPDWASGSNCWADGFQEPMSCGDPTYRHPHFTGQKSLIYFQFICCDTPQGGAEVQELLLSRIIWITLSSTTLLVCTLFVTAILLSKRARSEGWNLYLVFLAIPDAWCNLMIIIRNSLTIPGVPVEPEIHIFFASVEYFYAAANLWLNGVIIAQVYYVLRNSSPTKKIPPPSTKLVIKQSLAIYVFSAGCFMWAYYLYARGLIDHSLTRVVNLWVSTRALLVIPPLLFCLWVCFDVWYRDLLPKRGRTRVLSLFFLRVIVVFLVTWIPYFIIYEVAWNITYSTWMVNISYYLSSIQGTVSVLVALSKPDIYDAVMALPFLRDCKRRRDEKRRKLRASLRKGETLSSDAEPSRLSLEPQRKGDWFEDDVWGDIDLDNIMDGPPPDTVIVPEKPSDKSKSTIVRKGSNTSMDDFQDEEVRPPQKKKNPEDEAEWLNNFLQRFRQQQERQLNFNREQEMAESATQAETVMGDSTHAGALTRTESSAMDTQKGASMV